MKRTGLAVALGVVALTLAACSGSSADSSTTPPALTGSASPGASDGPFDAVDAETIANAVAEAVPSAGGVTRVDDNNDPDGMGRPSGSTSVAVISDSGGNPSEEPSVSWGAAVEVFETAEQAQERSDFIQTIVEDNPVLGSEYLYVSDTVVLRVSGELEPSVAAAYETSFRAAV